LTDIKLVPLVKGVKLPPFSCGNEPLDEWLRKHAKRTGGEGSNRTYLWMSNDSEQLLGYFTLAPAEVQDGDMARDSWPAIMLAKLAVTEELRGAGHGARLLLEAFDVAVRAADLVGGRYLAVDPQVPELVSYYKKLGFEAVDDGTACPRMLQKISTIRAALSQT
jgi:GNAT superfamily N-acetyltransferase